MSNPKFKSTTDAVRGAQVANHFAESGLPGIMTRPWNIIGHAVPGTIIVDFRHSVDGAIPDSSEILTGGLLTLLLFPWIANPSGSPWLQALLSGSSLTALGAGYWLTRAAGNSSMVSLCVGAATGIFASMPQMPQVTPRAFFNRLYHSNDPGGRLRRSTPYWGTDQ